MAYYSSDRIERSNRRKAIVITTVLYLGLFSFFLVKDEIAWADYLPASIAALLGDAPEVATVVKVDEVRP